ncbi:MAG: hypothetical protein WAN60_11605 [Candidatus Sulfotelmatobacter sp.]
MSQLTQMLRMPGHSYYFVVEGLGQWLALIALVPAQFKAIANRMSS